MDCRSHNGPVKFFRQRILTLPQAEILEYVKSIEKEAVAIKKDALKICWYMRGMSFEEAMTLSYEERSLVGDIIKDNLETTKKSGLPFF
jgi:GTP cyclohydrolase I